MMRNDCEIEAYGWTRAIEGRLDILLLQLLRQECLPRGIDLQPVIDGVYGAKALEKYLRAGPTGASTAVIETEEVSPDISSVPLAEILSFREEFGGKFRRHTTLLREIARAWKPSPTGRSMKEDELAASAEELRRLTRSRMRRIGNYYGIGLVWHPGDSVTNAISGEDQARSPIEVFSYFSARSTSMRGLPHGRGYGYRRY
jgi:hypothetical protein